MKTKSILSIGIWAVLATLIFNNNASAQYYRERRPVTRVVRVVPHRPYAGLPMRGAVVVAPPREAVVINVGPSAYNYHMGVFYRPVGPRYVVCAAPIGARVAVLPVGFLPITIGVRPYSYYYGTFYAPVPNGGGYEVVPPPVGARVDALPNGYEKMMLDGGTYYVVEGTYYKAVVDEHGEVRYEVVGQKGQ